MKQAEKKFPMWLVAAGILLAAVAAVVIMTVNKQPEAEVSPTVPTETVAETTEAVTEPVFVPEEIVVIDYDVVELVEGQIQTPYGPLQYPEGLADHLLVIQTSEQPYTIEFYAVMEEKQELRLFDISLGEGSGGNMGFVQTPGGEIPLNVTIYTLELDDTWTEGEIITVYAMQDVINEMIEQMGPKTEEEKSEEVIISQQPKADVTIHNLEIETPYCKLYYPARWSGTVTWGQDDSQEEIYKVHFYSRLEGKENQLLFSIYFGGDEGEQLGAVMSAEGIPVPVNLLVAQPNLEGWNAEDAEIVYSMQEASNELIARLPLLD
jgi:hypothetical protein